MSMKMPDAEKLSDLLCPVHAHLDEIGKLADFDNCIACIRVHRDELRAALDAVVRCATQGETDECRICGACEFDTDHRHTEDCPVLAAERLLISDPQVKP